MEADTRVVVFKPSGSFRSRKLVLLDKLDAEMVRLQQRWSTLQRRKARVQAVARWR